MKPGTLGVDRFHPKAIRLKPGRFLFQGQSQSAAAVAFNPLPESIDPWPKRYDRNLFEFPDSEGRVVAVSKFNDDDLPALTEMYDTYIPKAKANGLPPIKADVRHKWVKDAVGYGTSLLARIDGRIVGHTILCPQPPGDRAEFGIFIHHEYQGVRIGIRLSRLTLFHAITLGFEYLWLVVEPDNKRAIAMYNSLGFEFDGEMDMEASMTIDLNHLNDTWFHK